MALPEIIPKPPEAIASFPAADIASGTSFVVFLGGEANGSYILDTNTFYSGRVHTTTISTAQADTIQNDLDFDVKFNLARDIKGKFVVNVPIMVRSDSGAGGITMNSYVKVYVRHVTSGGSQSEIANATSETFSRTVGQQLRKQMMFVVLIDVTSNQHFKAGESLRITVEQHGWASTNNDNEYSVGHDPQNRATDAFTDFDFETAPTVMTVFVPFRTGD